MADNIVNMGFLVIFLKQKFKKLISKFNNNTKLGKMLNIFIYNFMEYSESYILLPLSYKGRK